jgi:uncharacterized protein YyaL (SSP411 family)
VRPATDDKVLAAWNGLAVTAFARAWQAFARPEDLHSAERAAVFVLDHLRREGRLRASWREGAAPLRAYLDDHAFLARGLLDLYEATFERRWLDASVALAVKPPRSSKTPKGGFFFTAADHGPSWRARVACTTAPSPRARACCARRCCAWPCTRGTARYAGPR